MKVELFTKCKTSLRQSLNNDNNKIKYPNLTEGTFGIHTLFTELNVNCTL